MSVSAYASHTVTTVLHNFALRTELLHAEQIRYVHCGLVGVRRNLRGVKVVKYYSTLSPSVFNASFNGFL